ncbi:hypothetical protein DPEC_G00281260 [Dallia pectoralis]|uniref:Uncharacterized protein n=1 Tax=Dallia pectoralis TaxID=75939 RepID=A0ACC2FMY3_DALPE|nr:hypothetical protein DPEC_G00281260 [Dallia pectoralis]
MAKHRRHPSTAGPGRGRVFPSVLERTRSLELVSLKGCPFSRTQMKGSSGQTLILESQQAGKGAEQNLVILESDNTVKAHYLHQDSGDRRLCRSPECLKVGGTGFSQEASTNEIGGVGHGDECSAMLGENPFLKLRPSLAMKPEVENDIREARRRDEELRSQRCSLYGGAEKTAQRIPAESHQTKGLVHPLPH